MILLPLIYASTAVMMWSTATPKTVMQEQFRAMIPADCFCGFNSLFGTNPFGCYQFDEAILNFIEAAVEAKIEH